MHQIQRDEASIKPVVSSRCCVVVALFARHRARLVSLWKSIVGTSAAVPTIDFASAKLVHRQRIPVATSTRCAPAGPSARWPAQLFTRAFGSRSSISSRFRIATSHGRTQQGPSNPPGRNFLSGLGGTGLNRPNISTLGEGAYDPQHAHKSGYSRVARPARGFEWSR